MTDIVKVSDLKTSYQTKTAGKVEDSVKILSKILSGFIEGSNIKEVNEIVVGLCEDYRIGNRVLFSKNDDTSPKLELDLGLLKNSSHSVPVPIQAEVKTRMVEIIQGLTSKGFTVTPVEAWTKQYQAVATSDNHVNVLIQLIPVECFKIGWSNA